MVKELIDEWKNNIRIIQPKGRIQRRIGLEGGYIVISGHDNGSPFYHRYTLPEFIKILKEQRELIKTLQS